MNMIEKVALSLVNSKRDRYDVPLLKDLNNLTSEALQEYRKDAISAIAVMREPTLFMLDTMDAIDTRELAKDMWQAGIDAALKEE